MQLLKILLRSINQNNPLSAVNYELLFGGGNSRVPLQGGEKGNQKHKPQERCFCHQRIESCNHNPINQLP